MLFLRQSTASQEILLGPFVDSTDGNTAETGLTIANTDIKIWVEGATTEASKNSGGATHISSGRYYAVLDATDTATVGKMEINVHVSGALPVRREFMVLEEAVYDAFYASGAVGYISNAPVNVAQISGDSTAADNLEAILDGTGGVTLVASAFTLTTPITANVTQISGDSAASDNAEAFFDGTGYDPNTSISVYRFIAADGGAEFVIPSETITAASQGTNVANIGDVQHDNEYVGMLLCIEHGDSSHRWCSPVVSSSASANTITLADTIPNLGYADPIPCLFLPGGAAYTVGIGANAITASAIASDAGTEIATAVWALETRTLTAGTNINGSTFTAIPWNASWDAEVQSEVQDAIEANHLDHLLAAAYDSTSEPGNASALLNVLVENDGGVPRFTANALEQAPAGGGGGGGTDWTSDERTAIRTILGIPGSGSTPSDPSDGVLSDIYSLIQSRPIALDDEESVGDTLQIVQGDTYDGSTYGKAMKGVTVTTDFTGCTVTFTVKDRYGTQLLQQAGSVASATRIEVSLTATQTGSLAIGVHDYDFCVTNGSTVNTQLIGKLLVIDDVT